VNVKKTEYGIQETEEISFESAWGGQTPSVERIGMLDA
jgi:hypothetical protein